MNTRQIKNAQGIIYAIEVDMRYAGVRTLAQLIGSALGVSNVNVRKPFSRSGDTRATFLFHGVECVITEPWGDSSEYWIGPAHEGEKTPDMSPIEQRLKDYKPPIYRKVLGDLLTMNLKSLVGR
jgi:hypothetical protein